MKGTIHAGDYVTVGDSDLTWLVKVIRPNRFDDGAVATLESGQTGRIRYEPLENITLYRYGDAE